jgi:sigma-B regulation protein RsbU (phosphoserine phosphatase)
LQRLGGRLERGPAMIEDKKHEDVDQVTSCLEFDVPLDLKNRALAAAVEGITISDPSLPDNPLIYANSGFERLTGYPVQSVLGKNCRFLQGPNTDPVTAETIRRAISEKTECTVEILNYRRDGSQFWNRLSITPVRDAQGDVTNFIGVQSDITARRNAEDALIKANSKMKSDLEAAARVQQSMLPQTLPEADGFRFAYRYHPCDELAGDTLNCFAIDKDHVAVYIVDVSGHGVAASLLSVTLNRMLLPIPGQSILYTASDVDQSEIQVAPPRIVAERLNRQFPFDERTSQFFTMVYGVLDTRTAMFKYVSAGHPYLILCGPDGRTRELRRDQFPIGIMSEAAYVEDTVHLEPGDRLFLYTDGVTEAGGESGEQYDSHRLCRTIATSRQETLDAVLGGILDSVESFCSDTEIQDDISLFGIESVVRP